MKINRMAEEKTAPQWILEDKSPEFFTPEYINQEEFSRIANMSKNLSENDIIDEREKVEKCAKNGKFYHFSSEWDNNVKSSLKEYAVVCGMDMSKFKEIKSSDIIEKFAGLYDLGPTTLTPRVDKKKKDTKIPEKQEGDKKVLEKKNNPKIETEDDKMTDEKKACSLAFAVGDPFKLDGSGDDDHMKKANWQEINRQLNMESKPSMMGGAVKPLRGGENYFINSDVKTARGQNSLTDPDAIEKLSKSEIEDTGARLKREREEKECYKKSMHSEWEKAKIGEMEKIGIIPKGKVFPTESMNVQSGIKGSSAFNFDVPDKTDGEKIAESNDNRRKLIQRDASKSHEFSVQKESVRDISSVFGEELKKFMK